ncbi:MAG: hypothetical protein QG650_495 [Patescibacteria group bacterium]|nr:hypothetical protein [Patescibacteria group bacterium]
MGKKFENVGKDLFGAAPIFEPIAHDGDLFFRETRVDSRRPKRQRPVFFGAFEGDFERSSEIFLGGFLVVRSRRGGLFCEFFVNTISHGLFTKE